MIGFIKKLFGVKSPEATTPVINPAVDAANSAPYKVPEPAAITPIPLVAKITPKKKPVPKKQQFAKKALAVKAPAVKAPAKKTVPKKSKPAA